MPHPFHSDGHENWERGSLPKSKSDSGPRLSLGNGATFVPKIQYFTVYFFAGSHRLRARAPYMRESSIALPQPGCPDGSYINLQALRGPTRHFFDRVGNSKN